MEDAAVLLGRSVKLIACSRVASNVSYQSTGQTTVTYQTRGHRTLSTGRSSRLLGVSLSPDGHFLINCEPYRTRQTPSRFGCEHQSSPLRAYLLSIEQSIHLQQWFMFFLRWLWTINNLQRTDRKLYPTCRISSDLQTNLRQISVTDRMNLGTLPWSTYIQSSPLQI